MPVGTVLLLVVAALIYFGVGQRLLDRMRLTDTQALIAIALMIGGSFITLRCAPAAPRWASTWAAA